MKLIAAEIKSKIKTVNLNQQPVGDQKSNLSFYDVEHFSMLSSESKIRFLFGDKVTKVSKIKNDVVDERELNAISDNDPIIKVKSNVISDNDLIIKVKSNAISDNDLIIKVKSDVMVENDVIEVKSNGITVISNKKETMLEAITKNDIVNQIKLDSITENDIKNKVESDINTNNDLIIEVKSDAITVKNTNNETKSNAITDFSNIEHRYMGSIKLIDQNKKYGFIKSKNMKDVFFAYAELKKAGFTDRMLLREKHIKLTFRIKEYIVNNIKKKKAVDVQLE